MENEMKQEYFVKMCERCGTEIKAPKECPEECVFGFYQVTCPRECKTHTFDYGSMKWWR